MTSNWTRGINYLLRACHQAGVPEYWHKNSPKTYTVKQHLIMLVFCRRFFDSYTEFVENLDNTILPQILNLKSVPDEGTLCKEEKRLQKYMQQVAIALAIAVLPKHFVAGADGTGLQTTKASAYYVKRVLGQFSRRGFARFELVVWKKYILAWELRLLPKDELAMLKSCWKQLRKRPTTLVYDKKGDCEAHHEWLEEQGVRSIAPVRKGARKGKYRRKLMKNFPQKTYNKRNRNENVNWMFKNRYGQALSAYTVKGRRSEIATKVTAHNLWARLSALLIQNFSIWPQQQNIYNPLYV
ncbi:MAG TPA: hypothetical protein VJJ82_02385 [Candidatus Nanoarchaeia archaeon]|nr:hypothetical protein [Candidatus Nanoarchaeia archaeon]